MPRKTSQPNPPSALDRLNINESARVWSQMLKRHPELRAEAEVLALEMITKVDPEGVAEDVVYALEGIEEEDIWSRSGSDQLGGYADPGEAAYELCDEALEPFLEKLKRLLTMGLEVPALAQVQGMLLGLHALEGKLPDDAEEYPGDEGVYSVLGTWAEASPAASDRALMAWADKELPDWAEDVRHTLSSKRKTSRKAR
jgi:hypothetical protein